MTRPLAKAEDTSTEFTLSSECGPRISLRPEPRRYYARRAASNNNPVVAFPAEALGECPGPGHHTIEEAVRAGGEVGTRSILDIDRVGEEPGFGVAGRYSPRDLRTLFGTEKPTKELVFDAIDDVVDAVGRGTAIYVLLYSDGVPCEVLFAGCSCD